jgi:hypothetical protein
MEDSVRQSRNIRAVVEVMAASVPASELPEMDAALVRAELVEFLRSLEVTAPEERRPVWTELRQLIEGLAMTHACRVELGKIMRGER